MTGGWAVVVVAVGLLGWTVLVDVRLGAERRLARRWVRWARTRGAWAGPLSLLASVAALAAYGLLVGLGAVLAAALGNPPWAPLLVVPAMLAYVHVAVSTAPLSPTGYARWRAELRSAGADVRLQRQIAWWAGPPSLLGVCAIALTLFRTFLS